MSSIMSSATASTSAASGAATSPHNYRIAGIMLAVGSGVLIGSSFVFKKKGLIASQRGGEAGHGVAYLKSPMWWLGMTMMIVGELCNFGAYAFVEAIVVTPLGALSVVICAILSSIFLDEKLSFFGWIGCFQCIAGSIMIALNAPPEQSVSTINEFKHLFLAPWFLAFGGVVIAAALVIIIFIAPKYGKKSMLWYILVCSLIGGLSVSCTQGLGAAIVTSIRGYNQFKNWFTYFLLAFVAITLVTEIYFLNVALALFNTAMVTPTYYVIFTTCTLVTSVILYQGLKTSAQQLLTVVLSFCVICSGIIILQMSKIDPEKLQKEHNLDRKSTLLLKAAQVEPLADKDDLEAAKEEEPGLDALRGFNGLAGTLVRARRRSTLYHPDGEVVHSILIPGLGRRTSRHRADSSATTPISPSSPLASPGVVDGTTMVVPNGHNLTKANTAPPGSSPTSSKFPSRPLTSFWHRRTGSGPRKTKIGENSAGEPVPLTPTRGNKLQRLRSPGSQGPPTDGHSFAGESVNEAGEEEELSMRRLLVKENNKGKGNEQHIKFPDILVSPSGKNAQQAHIDPNQGFANAISASPAGGATPAGHTRAATEPSPTRERISIAGSRETDYFNALGPHILVGGSDSGQDRVSRLQREEDQRESDGTIRPSDVRLMQADNSSVPSIVVTDEESGHSKPHG